MGGASAVLDTEDVMLAKDDVVFERIGIEKPSKDLRRLIPKLIVTVAAWKGGVGKTELAKELGWIFNGVLVDLDWDNGGASPNWGYRHQTRTTAPLLDALETNRIPRPLTGHGVKADLVPSHPDFAGVQPDEETMANALESWSRAWKRPVVIDTHPGGVPSTLGVHSDSNCFGAGEVGARFDSDLDDLRHSGRPHGFVPPLSAATFPPFCGLGARQGGQHPSSPQPVRG